MIPANTLKAGMKVRVIEGAVHAENPEKPYWCVCGLAGMYETPDVWVCYRSAKRRR